MIQAVIARMAGNSFLIKGWSITLTAALLGFAAKDHDASFAWIAFGAAVVFAVLDGRYLALERRYIALYKAATAPDADVGWSLDAGDPGFGDVINAVASWSVAMVHGTTMLAALAVALFD
jgi:hypothetical protein